MFSAEPCSALGGNSIPWLHCPVLNMQTLNDVRSTRLQPQILTLFALFCTVGGTGDMTSIFLTWFM